MAPRYFSMVSAAVSDPARTARAMSRAGPGLPLGAPGAPGPPRPVTGPRPGWGHLEPPVLDGGRLRQDLVPVERGPRLVGTRHVAKGERVRGGLDPFGVEGSELGGMGDHRGQLGRVEVELIVGQVDAGQAGHVGGVVAGQHGGGLWFHDVGVVVGGRGVAAGVSSSAGISPAFPVTSLLSAPGTPPVGGEQPVDELDGARDDELGVVVERGHVVALVEPHALDGARHLLDQQVTGRRRHDVVVATGEKQHRTPDPTQQRRPRRRVRRTCSARRRSGDPR